MTDVVGIGARMAAARAKKQASQVKAAAMLEISDKSYKNYEAEKRELPLAVAVGFCEAFEVELEWLVYGTQANAGEKTIAVVSETIEALVSEAQARSNSPHFSSQTSLESLKLGIPYTSKPPGAGLDSKMVTSYPF